MDGFPRRNQLDKCIPEENAIREVINKIEVLGAHPLLTECVTLLGDAREKLADWVDLPNSGV